MAEDRPQTSTRDHGVLREQLEGWLARQVRDPVVSDLVVPPANGMSSETVLFDASWDDGEGGRHEQSCVVRIPPDLSAEPVFRTYDMELQYRAMQLVGERAGVPVPGLLWLENDASYLGEPFFVMERVDGLVPPDLMPYPFGDNWFHDADPVDHQTLERSTVEVLARIHSIPADDPDTAFLAIDAPGDTALRRHVNDQRAFYEWVSADGIRSPLIERAFDWLEANWPDEGPAVVSWGDARIGNVMYRNFEPVAVLDWEMAGHAPRELDLGWMIYLHRFFQDLAEQYGMPGMPNFMRVDEVAAAYEKATGYTPVDLRFHILNAALRHAIVMSRITRRQVLFGEAVMPDDPDHTFIHHATLAEMLDGTYWSRLEP
ncbi:MAG: phosphotransferase family protein [Ilumatobacter sp.]|nr:MAG: phosphotransferase family protein [Ilumatobacter sp.]